MTQAVASGGRMERKRWGNDSNQDGGGRGDLGHEYGCVAVIVNKNDEFRSRQCLDAGDIEKRACLRR